MSLFASRPLPFLSILVHIVPIFAGALCAALLSAGGATAAIVDFEDLGLVATPPGAVLDPPTSGGSFVSGGVTFLNDGAFSGFSASTQSDTTTADFTNQYSSITGGGAGGSATFGVAYAYDPVDLSFSSPRSVVSAAFTNTTYAALSMLNGDAFAKQFGGVTGDDPDWLRLTIQGVDTLGAVTGQSVEFYLGDYRFADNALDYVVDAWTVVDLSGLGQVSGLRFSLDGSDVGSFGLNTPAYFAIDDLVTIPEPTSACLLALGLLGLSGLRESGVRGARRRE
jgi:hypothetical protein